MNEESPAAAAPEQAAPAPGQEQATASPAPTEGAASVPTAEPSGSWRDNLPDAIRDNPSLMDTKTVTDLAQRFLETKQMVGNSLRVPTQEAGEDTVKAFTDKILANENLGLMRRPDPTNTEAMEEVYNTLGRPESSEGYEAVEGVDPAAYSEMKEVAHKLGLSKRQFEELASAQVALQNDQISSVKQEVDAGRQEVRKEWGLAFEDKVGRATSMLELTKAPQALIDGMASGNVSAEVMRWVDSLATQLGTEGAPMARELAPVTSETTAQLRQVRDEITQRMIKENLTNVQASDLQARLLKVSSQIMRAEGRE